MSPEKEDARKLLDNLPENATWDDIMYQFYVKKKLADALKSAAEEPTVSHDSVKQRFRVK